MSPLRNCRLKSSNNKSRGWPPELQRFHTTEDVTDATQVLSTQQLRTLSFWIGLIGSNVVGALAVAGILVLARRWILFPRGVFVGIVAGVTAVTGGLGSVHFTASK